MRIVFASDIHGSATACEAVLNAFETEHADRLILLGDLLYHGPRNDLPEAYQPKTVLKMLNEFRITPLCVRGNCDATVDQMVLHFPILADYALLPLDETRCAFLTHGHLFNLDNPPPHQPGDLLIHGHTHLHAVETRDGLTYLNPGSAAIPFQGQPKSYMLFDGVVFRIKAFTGETLQEFSL